MSPLSSLSTRPADIVPETVQEVAQDAQIVQFPRTPARQTGRRWQDLTGSEAGMATAEYAIATLAAVAFAGLLVLILRSGEVRGLLMNLVELALTAV